MEMPETTPAFPSLPPKCRPSRCRQLPPSPPQHILNHRQFPPRPTKGKGSTSPAQPPAPNPCRSTIPNPSGHTEPHATSHHILRHTPTLREPTIKQANHKTAEKPHHFTYDFQSRYRAQFQSKKHAEKGDHERERGRGRGAAPEQSKAEQSSDDDRGRGRAWRAVMRLP